MSEGEVEKLSDTPRCDTRRECALRAADAMGVSEVEFHDFPDQRLETVPFIGLIKTVEEALDTFRPTVVVRAPRRRRATPITRWCSRRSTPRADR